MQKLFSRLLLLLLAATINNIANAQTTISTTGTFLNNNGSGVLSLNFENTNSYDVIITDVEGVTGSTGTCTAELWFRTTPLTAAPTGASTGNGWTLGATGTFTGVANTTSTTTQPILTGINVVIPANTNCGMQIFATGQRYFTMAAPPYTFSGGGVNLRFDASYSYGGNTPPTAPSNASRGWIGKITFKPACVNPSGLATTSITSNSVGFSWTAVPNSQGYEYAVTASATPPASGTPTNATNGAGIGLLSSTNYYIHVRNSCIGGSFSNWTTLAFTTLLNPCASPTGIVANAPTASSANFSWNAMPGTLGYEYVINQIAAPPIGAGTPTNNTNGTATGLTGGATYYIHVRQKCSSTGGTWSDWASVQFIMPECKKPDNIIFSNITGNSVDVIWSVMLAANYYQYQVDQTPADPTSGGSGYSTTTGMTAHVTALSPNTWYYVHIRSMCFINDSSGWALDSFITQSYCAAPVVSVNNQNTSSPNGFWPVVPSAYSYEWAYSTSTTPPAFGAEIFDAYTPVIALPADGKDYYLHVRTKCNSIFEFSTWSTAPLRTTATGLAAIDDNNTSINIYPNPAKDRINIQLLGATSGVVAVYNIASQLLMQEQLTSAEHTLNISSLPKGVYILKYENGESRSVTRFVKN
jgi:hypothetical protein